MRRPVGLKASMVGLFLALSGFAIGWLGEIVIRRSDDFS
jgi:hypothetical protein